MLKGVFIGAGGRATSAHYPALQRASTMLEFNAICDIDRTRLDTVGSLFGIEDRYTDFHDMLAKVDCDVVYAVTRPQSITDIAVAILDAGKHLFIEKPPGTGSADAARIADAATRNGKLVCVGLQRRWTPLLRQAISLVEARGPIRLAVSTFHKNLMENDEGGAKFSRLYEQDIHMIDFTRWVCGGQWDQVLSRGDDAYTGWMNAYHSIVHFSSGAVAVNSGIGHAGARYYRIELHGNGISAYILPPVSGEIFTDNNSLPEVIKGRSIPGAAGGPLGGLDEGVDAMHLDFLQCIIDGREPLTNIHDVIKSMRLIEEIGNLDSRGIPLSD